MDEVALFVSSKNIGNVYPFPTKDAAILKQKQNNICNIIFGVFEVFEQ